MNGNELIILLTRCALLLVLASGCQPPLQYSDFRDEGKRGHEQFIKDAQSCKNLAMLHARKNEGSQAAGELVLLQRQSFISCMEKKNWMLHYRVD
jgi:hypothetical protein